MSKFLSSPDSEDLWIPPISANPKPLSEVLRNSECNPVKSLSSNDTTTFAQRTAARMKSPYQNIPSPDGLYCLYEFRFPEPAILAKLVGVAPECFGNPNQTIGFLFSKALAEDSTVCRVPLYLSRGMARAYVQLTNRIHLSQTQFSLVLSTHHVLSELLCELITRDMSSVTFSSTAGNDEGETFCSFSQFKYDPSNAPISALISIVTWPGSTIDFKACEHLLSGSLTTRTRPIVQSEDTITVPVRGIVPHRRIPLIRLPQHSWSGVLLRPMCLPAADFGLFACAGPLDCEAAEKDIAKASVKCYRLSRHPQAARVEAGGCKLDTACRDLSVVYNAGKCTIHPLSAWLWLHLSLVPVVLYQVNRALLSVELARQLNKLCPIRIDVRLPVLIPDRLDAPKCMLAHLHPATELDMRAATSPLWPSDSVIRLRNCCHVNEANASNLLEATTTLGAADVVNLERLELLGDALLKLIATMIVYQQLPKTSNEGQLTDARMPLVCNSNLKKIATQLGWPYYCTGRPYLARDHFIPPGYTLSDQADRKRHYTRLFMELSAKSVADMVEAVLGYLLTYGGLNTASKLLHHFNISLCTGSERSSNVDNAQVQWRSLFLPTDACSISTDLSTLSLRDSPLAPRSVVSTGLSAVEQLLAYRFQDQSHLSCALTHGSFLKSMDSTNSYQRLEFLGDAVLDYVVTLDMYRRNPDFDPGKLTQCRSLVTCNASLAYILVKLGIHHHIQHNLTDLPAVVKAIENMQSKQDSDYAKFGLLPLNFIKGKPTKLLSDVFEAIIGAVFFDSDGNLAVTSRVILRLLHDRIDFITAHLHEAPKATDL